MYAFPSPLRWSTTSTIQFQQTSTHGPEGALPAHIRGHCTAGTVMGKVEGIKLHPWICSCRAASGYNHHGRGLFHLPPSGLLGSFALSWVTSSMVCWVWRHSGYVLQTNFCSRHSSQLCTCRSKPQRTEFSSSMSSVCSWLGNSLRHAVAACHSGVTASSKTTSALQEETQRKTRLSIHSQKPAKTLHRNTAVVVDTSYFLPSLQLFSTLAGCRSTRKLPWRFPAH